MFLSTRLISLLVALLALLAIYNLYSVSSRDPTSAFFNPRKGYAPIYSSQRIKQAEAYVAPFNTSDTGGVPLTQTTPKAGEGKKKLCVGIPSIARKGARYLVGAVGSLLQGLSEQERSEIYFTVLIPHSDPKLHPAYTEKWLGALVDEVLTYDSLKPDESQHVKDMEQEGGLFREKGLYDYSYLIRHCAMADTPYIAIFEDDIVAMDGWYHRTLRSIDEAEKQSALKHALPDFLYLRLFYTEEFFGWNAEFAPDYLFYSTWAFAIPAAVLLYLRSSYPNTRQLLTDRVLAACFAFITLLIALFFALGRVTVFPLPPGVHHMPNFGCCSQAFVFPTHKARELVEYFTARKAGFVDVITEEFAREKEQLRWAVTPSLVQHVGRKSSKEDDFGPESKHGLSVAEKIWSFGFERYDEERLRLEHEAVVGEMRKRKEEEKKKQGKEG